MHLSASIRCPAQRRSIILAVLVVSSDQATVSLVDVTAGTCAQATVEPTRHHARRPPPRARSARPGPAADATLGRVLARERPSIPTRPPPR